MSKVTARTPPKKINFSDYGDHLKLFLAGSIDMGKAEDWQSALIDEIRDLPYVKSTLVMNPRRPDWDSSWEQTIENDQFYNQVSWELEGLEKSDIIFYNFTKDSKAPITFAELGLYLNSAKRIIVCCPDGFYRKGNVDIMCERYGRTCFSQYDTALSALKTFLALGKFGV